MANEIQTVLAIAASLLAMVTHLLQLALLPKVKVCPDQRIQHSIEKHDLRGIQRTPLGLQGKTYALPQ